MNRMITVAANNFKEFFGEILAWLYDFFNPELEGYVNFDFGSGELVNIRFIIFGIFAGVFCASLYMVYVKNFIGRFVRKLLAEGCLSEEKAQTLGTLGFAKDILVRRALKGSLLASTVSRVMPPEDGEGKTDEAQIRYYIKEEKKYVAEMRFHARGSGWPTLLFVLLISVICIFVIFAFLPQILRLADNTISIFSVAGNTLN